VFSSCKATWWYSPLGRQVGSGRKVITGVDRVQISGYGTGAPSASQMEFSLGNDAAKPSEEEIIKNMEYAQRTFNERLNAMPEEWSAPLVDVMDTYQHVALRLVGMRGFVVQSDAVALTKLVLDRKVITDQWFAEKLAEELE